MRDVIAEAEFLYYFGSCDQAVGLLKESLSSDPTRGDILASLVQLLLDSERYESAKGFLRSFKSKSNNSLITIQHALCLEATGDLLAAEILADQLLESDQLRAEALALKARLMLRAERIKEAEALFKMAIESDNSCSRAWFGLALLKQRKKELSGAFDLLRQAFECSPDSRDIAVALHKSSVDCGHLMQGEEAFREALNRRPINRRLRFLLIDLLLRQHRIPEAMSEIEAALVDFGPEEGLLDAALKIRKQFSLSYISTESGSETTVSLCMIVKNERHHLSRCLKSAKAVVNEIIVVDTGSSDETKDIAHIFGAKVYDFEWDDDFSKARNFSLSKATGEWIMVLDADEVLSARDYEKFRDIVRYACTRPVAFRIQTRNYSYLFNAIGFRQNQGEFPEEQGIGWYPSEKVRLFTNDSRIRFEYPVHELVEPSLEKIRVPIEECPVAVHHYGTLSNIQIIEKTKNYRKLGQIKLKKNFRNASTLRELAVQLAQIGNHAEALETWQQLVKLQPKSADAYLNMGNACWHLGRYGDAVSFAEKALRIDPSQREAKFNLAYSLLLLGKSGAAKECLERLIEEHPDYHASQFLFCIVCICQQETDQARPVLEKLRALAIGDYIGESFVEIAKRFLEAARIDYAHCTLEAAAIFGYHGLKINALLEKCNAAA